MKTIEQNVKQQFPSADFGRGDAVLDITASGRYWRTSQLLRIDLISWKESGALLISWISEQESDEYELLTALSDALGGIKRIITFNGNAFDLPHLHQKYKAYGLMDPIQGKQYLDLMLRLRPLSRFLALPSGKLADYAGFLQLIQEDVSAEANLKFKQSDDSDETTVQLKQTDSSGKRILQHKQADGSDKTSFQLKQADGSDKTLLKNPLESTDNHKTGVPNDALCTLECMSLLHYADFLEHGAEILEVTTDEERVIFRLQYPDGFPADLSVHDSCFHLRFSKDGIVLLSSRIYNGAVRYYHTDVKNYWYLPLEGYAIHKSAAQYVDKSRREKAVRENCYHLVPVSSAFLQDPAMLDGYLKSVMVYLAT